MDLISQPESPAQTWNWHLAAISTEKIHSLLRRLSDQDWLRLKLLIRENLQPCATEADIETLERMFRKGEAIGASAGGVIFRMVQAITAHPILAAELKSANERIRARVRFVLREMSDDAWLDFKAAVLATLRPAPKEPEVAVLELVFRIGESVTNVEVAALALAARTSGRRLLDPEVARRNALIKAGVPGHSNLDPQIAYLAAKRALDSAQQTTRRAQCTLAYAYAEPSQPFKHARNTVFKLVDAIAESPQLIAEVVRLEHQLTAVKPLNRDKMRWTLHRMPIADKLKIIRCIPLNTILMFQEDGPESKVRDQTIKAARDRRLAFDLFVKGQNDEQLAETYGLSLNAVKNAVGGILQTLIDKPLARQLAHQYLARVEKIQPLGLDQVRRLMKQLTTRQRAEILERIPNCSWKARDLMPLHKHLFLDYLSGDWVLAALVAYYNLEKAKRLTGTFRLGGTLTVRGANSAIAGLLHKIAEEPDLRQQLLDWTSPQPDIGSPPTEALARLEPTVEQILPPTPKARPEPALPIMAQPALPQPADLEAAPLQPAFSSLQLA